jgi:hypothetical protein
MVAYPGEQQSIHFHHHEVHEYWLLWPLLLHDNSCWILLKHILMRFGHFCSTVGQAHVKNSRESYKIKTVAQKKLVSFGTFRLIPYLHKNWSLSAMNLPVQEVIRKKWVCGRCKQLKNLISKIKSHMLKKSTIFIFFWFLNWSKKSCNQATNTLYLCTSQLKLRVF